MLQGSFKDVSRKIEGCFNGVLSGSQWCLKEVQWVFARKIEECSKGHLRVIQGRFKAQGYLKEVQMVFQGSFKNISGNFYLCLKRGSTQK